MIDNPTIATQVQLEIIADVGEQVPKIEEILSVLNTADVSFIAHFNFQDHISSVAEFSEKIINIYQEFDVEGSTIIDCEISVATKKDGSYSAIYVGHISALTNDQITAIQTELPVQIVTLSDNLVRLEYGG